MSGSDPKPGEGSCYASPPCMAHEVDPAYFDPLGVDPEQARDVARWRKAERSRLLDMRGQMSVSDRARIGEIVASILRRLLAERLGDAPGLVLSGYWPIRGELDLRPLLSGLHDMGAQIALPLVETRAAPLVFRRWTPQTRMVRGHWNILVPPPGAEAVVPQVTLAPLVGWDAAGYRLGYGGGYFDRTLAALSPRPFTIGVGVGAARLATIYPQPHDIPLDVIVTEDGPRTGAELG
ncbi:5-formyltetrahydrofolate cyclo-ligase [Tropicimonas sp.]|uniref:5-formyltetrahydrofolate cyclo-ligase n=1 Tax=Tropicimonas sp. TaxID=2067044 RepID=UPI003A8C6A50